MARTLAKISNRSDLSSEWFVFRRTFNKSPLNGNVNKIVLFRVTRDTCRRPRRIHPEMNLTV